MNECLPTAAAPQLYEPSPDGACTIAPGLRAIYLNPALIRVYGNAGLMIAQTVK